MSTDLRVHHGSRDLIEVLEEALVAAKAGELEAVVLTACGADGSIDLWTACREDAPFIWSRMVAAASNAQFLLLRDGL